MISVICLSVLRWFDKIDEGLFAYMVLIGILLEGVTVWIPLTVALEQSLK